MTNVLIIGQNGQVSTYLQNELQGDYSVIAVPSTQLDLLNLAQIQGLLEEFSPSLIINPAAYTAVDLAEQEEAKAETINHLAVAEIAHFCATTDTPLIHFSTDYVFDGTATEPYKETERAQPNGVYGATKHAGELAVLHAGAPAVILRTSWVYSNHGKNFYKTMLALAESRKELSVVADQIGSPTYARSIAVAVNEIVAILLQQGGLTPEQQGIYHFTCAGEASWCDFANAIFTKHRIKDMHVTPVTTQQYPTPAKRPAYSVLDNAKLFNVFNIALPEWQTALDDCVAETKQLT